MTATLNTVSDVVDQYGAYDGIPDHEYHSDKTSLSSSGARALLNENPAIFRWNQDHPKPAKKDEFDVGHAAHALVLGEGAEIVDIGFDAYTTIAAKEARDTAYAENKTPLRSSDYRAVHAMVAELRKHPLAEALFGNGVAERSLYYPDPETGVTLRARPDFMPHRGAGRQLIVDYKTSTTSSPSKFAKSADDFGYYMQDPWYRDAVIGLGIDDDPAFIFVNQMKTAPYLVSVVELDRDAVELGRRRNRQAVDLFAHCTSTNTWPGWGDEPHLVSLPAWTHRRFEEI
ncbi:MULTISPECIES: PD-(D/E)XK nuclease-like domain-containing protein [unclassified Rhodococcus (in: high G+C Gram-positive bacteria)]|uniref:PD-(D/E)XK nuclease-like domain-containing protein n=1 Tax=unclassified Rhodococcus (in: high G+C Gram-positive bacteria) TaxID=192944 RepID=UPI0006F1E133|nr:MULTISPECIES: PD-(D/E)XK nuclease-like domain-containing protein [unclassified Rhodococcus (in: high G+C Gram-positive bacteria)]KQU30316.1 hypothetical protein ASG69_04465 [Rhodococcus sp. Leaf225]KQU44779.1 hypothetical protein ASH03_12675 [Rhodococcus sp. Leaf258]